MRRGRRISRRKPTGTMQQTRFLDSISHLPKASGTTRADASAGMGEERLARLWETRPELYAASMQDARLTQLLSHLGAHSPYLLGLILHHTEWFQKILDLGVDAAAAALQEEMSSMPATAMDANLLMRDIRRLKARWALLDALADITGQWKLKQVTGALTRLASFTLDLCCNHLLWQGHSRGEIRLKDEAQPMRESGLIVLGMGKFGAEELNYSSDIDLILLYERGALEYIGKHDIQRFFSRLALELVRLMQERTADGYVFRTDLRLRPDPASTPPALSTAGAMTYYETVGQNWERAAMIKAKPVSGDIAAGEQFLRELRPFIWRKYLDYPAIDDILSIKRQMHARAGQEIQLLGHNVKTGAGGIREVEFFAQVHQLIWGGRLAILRSRGTCETLVCLTEAKLLDDATRIRLTESYEFLRMVEHRLQMVADEQTHKLPATEEGLDAIAFFCGFEDAVAFRSHLLEIMHFVHENFADAFSEKQELSSGEGNLVFTGVDPDEGTLETLRSFGFSDPEHVWRSIAAWHRGSRRATRTKRARELITEITPVLLAAIGKAAEPQQAFLRLDEFVSRLPSGVQLFALLQAQPQLTTLLARILGGAPGLAEVLSRQPSLFDVVLSGDIYANAQSDAGDWLQAMLSHARNADEQWQQLVRYRQEQEFWVGIRVLRGELAPRDALPLLSTVAERVLNELMQLVEAEFARDYGRIEGGQFAILAMGRLGAHETCFGSDLDLVFVYDVPDAESKSDGARSFDARVYYNRLAQRIIGLLEAPGPYGKLYAVDTRLRPSGKDGHLAVQLEGFRQYFEQSAWSFEYMALCRARPVAGHKTLQEKISREIDALFKRPQTWEKLRADVAELRQRITQEFPPRSGWDVKYAQGGLLELDFLIQSLALARAPQALPSSSLILVDALEAANIFTREEAISLRASYEAELDVQALLRLCQADGRRPPSEGVLRLMHQILGLPETADLGKVLSEQLHNAHDVFTAHIQP